MQPSQSLLNFLAQPDMENMRLTAYLDGGGVATIGVGHTLGVKLGDTCTTAQALAWLSEDMAVAAHAVADALTNPNQNEFDAFCSLCFNIGIGNFAKASAVEFFNAGNMDEAAKRILWWDKVAGVMSAGLLKRRMCEAMMMLGEPWQIERFADESKAATSAETLTRCMSNYKEAV